MTAGMLVADDLSEGASDLVRTAADVAWRLGLPLTVLHVVSNDQAERFRQEQPEDSGYLDSLMDRVRSQLETRVTAAVGRERADEVNLIVRRGEVDEVVAKELGDGGYAFGAIGVRSRSRVGKLVFGSAAQSILLTSPCPVLTVPVG